MSETKHDFDYSSIDSDLGWTERGNPDINADDSNEPDPINHLREVAIERIDEVMKRAFRILRHSRNKRISIDAMALAFGWYGEIGGITNATSLAKRYKCTKANINKFVIQFQKVLPTGIKSIEPMPGQRSEKACEKFTLKRKEQCT